MRKTVWIALLFIFVLALTGCNGNNGAENGLSGAGVQVKNPVSGGTLKLYSQRPDTYNPLKTQITSVSKLLTLIYEPLYSLDAKLRPVPVLARTHSISSDGLTFRIFLQEGVLYQDGAAFTAQDVVYSVDQIRASGSVYQSNVKNIESVTAPSATEVEFRLKARDSNFLSMLTFPIIKQGTAETTTSGTGPFRISELASHKSMELSAFESWHGAHRAYIDKIQVEFMENAVAAANAFRINLIDVFELPYEDFDQVSLDTKSGKVVSATNTLTYIGINSDHPFLNDPQVRGALSMMIDKESIITQLLFTNGSQTSIPVHPDYELYPKEYEASIYDTKAALEALKGVGFTGGQRNSVLSRVDMEGNNQPFHVTLLVSDGNTRRRQMGEMIASMLRDCGIETEIAALPFEEYSEKVHAGEYDLYLGEVSLPNNFDLTGLLLDQPGQKSLSGYHSQQMQSYLDAIKLASDDTSKASALQQFAAFFKQETPCVPICFNDNVMYYNGNVSGVNSLSFEAPFFNAYDWFISSDASQD